jgi:hypothetical protein
MENLPALPMVSLVEEETAPPGRTKSYPDCLSVNDIHEEHPWGLFSN